MSDTEKRLREQLDQLKTYFANVFVLLEQALDIDPQSRAEELIEINSKIQTLMSAAGQKSLVFQQTVQEQVQSGREIDEALRNEVNEFCEKVPGALRNLIDQLRASRSNLEERRKALKAQLLRLQQNHKGLAGYKSQTKHHPKFFDSTI